MVMGKRVQAFGVPRRRSSAHLLRRRGALSIPTVGVRFGYRVFDAPAADEDTVMIGASWFVRRNVGLDLTLSRDTTDINSFFAAGDDPPTNRLILRVIGRL